MSVRLHVTLGVIGSIGFMVPLAVSPKDPLAITPRKATIQEWDQTAGRNNYVTNAEHVLNVLRRDKSTAAAFFLRPVRSTSCEYMYLEIGKKNAEGQYDLSNAVFPGRDKRENFGQEALENQLQFVELDGQGEYGVIGWGCKPYNRDLEIATGLLATFDVTYGKLNYIGELGYEEVGQGAVNFAVAERTDYAKLQIAAQRPALGEFFHPAIMQKHVVELTSEQEAAIAATKGQIERDRVYKAALARLDTRRRNLLSRLKTLETQYKGVRADDIPAYATTEIDQLKLRALDFDRTVREVNFLTDRNQDKEIIINYLALREAQSQADDVLYAFISKHNINNMDFISLRQERAKTNYTPQVRAEYSALLRKSNEARDAVRAFVNKHDGIDY